MRPPFKENFGEQSSIAGRLGCRTIRMQDDSRIMEVSLVLVSNKIYVYILM
jgi:hypothetical protein